jgi:TatD DNase family protein
MPVYDAHNHLQDERLTAWREPILAACRSAGIRRMVVNGACAEDWPEVGRLAAENPDLVIPSLGWHPWYLHERRKGWEAEFREWLDRTPGALVGEIGLDRWILDQPAGLRARYVPALGDVEPASFEEQVGVFRFQLAEAAARGLPASIHCLQCWGRMLEILKAGPVPACGFLLHSYGGPAEMIEEFARLGAYFSFPGYFLHPRKERQRDVFRKVPLERLLVETDAPDQSPPEEFLTCRLEGSEVGRPLNHPANLVGIQQALAGVLGLAPDRLEVQLEENFRRLFLGRRSDRSV